MSGAARSGFETTRWSLVLAAGGDPSQEAHRALEALCDAYWYPLYAYVRRQGYDADEARDLTQSFFLKLLERRDVQRIRPEHGRFRAFLVVSMRHFLSNDRVHRHALKRGGGQVPLSLELETAEASYVREPADRDTPETIFDRRWALTLLSRVLQGVRQEWQAAGKGPEFERLKGCLMGELPQGGYKALAVDLGSTEAAAKMAAHRLRRRFHRRVRETIADTVTDGAVDEEIQYLLAALRG